MDTSLFNSVDKYISDLFIPHDEALDAAERSHAAEGLPEINVSPVQGKFLQIMASLCNAKNILEIGTLAGYSTIWMARALAPGGKVVTIEFDQHHADVARRNFQRAGLDEKIELRVGSALDVLEQMVSAGEGPFDMIFIDADKQPYAEYFQLSLRLSRPGTLIIADNVIRKGKVVEENSDDELVRGVQRFNSMAAADPRVNAIVLQMTGVKGLDGMALAVVK